MAFMGRLDPWKRPHLLVKEWQSIVAQPGVAPARLDIHGIDTGNLAGTIRQTIKDLHLESVVACHGGYDLQTLDSLLQNVDLVLNPSQFEGLGLVLFEAMNRGVPVVATEAFGSGELGEENPDVLITPGDNWDQFKAGVSQMARRIRAGEIDSLRLQRWVEARYSHAHLAEEWKKALLQPREYFGLRGGTR